MTTDTFSSRRLSVRQMIVLEVAIVLICAPLAYFAFGSGRYQLSFEASYGAQCLPWRAYLVERLQVDDASALQHGQMVTATVNEWSPWVKPGTTVGKFVVALPGDRVEITEHGVKVNKGGSLGFIEPLAIYRADAHVSKQHGVSPASMSRRKKESFYRDLAVPEGHVFIMGASPLSQDSRYYGAIPIKNVTGKTLAVLW